MTWFPKVNEEDTMLRLALAALAAFALAAANGGFGWGP